MARPLDPDAVYRALMALGPGVSLDLCQQLLHRGGGGGHQAHANMHLPGAAAPPSTPQFSSGILNGTAPPHVAPPTFRFVSRGFSRFFMNNHRSNCYYLFILNNFHLCSAQNSDSGASLPSLSLFSLLPVTRPRRDLDSVSKRINLNLSFTSLRFGPMRITDTRSPFCPTQANVVPLSRRCIRPEQLWRLKT